jgi:hypothetical protein
MSQMEFVIGVLVSAASWMIGIAIARFVMRRYLGWGESVEPTSSAHTDDIVDFDKSERPYIPVRVVKEHGQYYAWFALNDSFIGQSTKIEDLRQMAHESILKQVGLRLEFAVEKTPKKRP